MRKCAYIFNDGELRRKDNTVCFLNEDGNKYLPIEDISDLYVFGEVSVSKKFLEYATQKGILIHFFNYHEYYAGTYYPREHYNSGYMILKQAEHYLDERKRTVLARKFVEGSYRNILQVLKYYTSRGKPDLEEHISRIESYWSMIAPDTTIDQLMAIEGNIRAAYYSAFDIILQNPDFVFESRTKRPPRNHMNTLLSFGNSILYTMVLSEIYNTHLDPRIGFLHSTNNRRFTLNLDVAEIFKPILVDRVNFTLLGRNLLYKRLNTTINYKKLSKQVSYRRLIRLELYKIEKHLMGEEEYVPFLSSW